MAEENIELLLIEDDRVYRELVRQILDSGYIINEASTGNQGLELARSSKPDCILLDYRSRTRDADDHFHPQSGLCPAIIHPSTHLRQLETT